MIWLMDVHITRGVQWTLFKNLSKLEDLELMQTDATSLGTDFRNNVSPKLTKLFMVCTKTVKLEKNAFANLKSLSVLQIRNSTIKILKRIYLNYVLGDDCPPAKLILPCICEVFIQPTIFCLNIEKPEFISDMVDKTGGMKFRRFLLADSSFTYLPTSALISEKFEILAVYNSTFVSLFDKPPSIKNSLSEMWLMDVHIARGIEWNLFKNLNKLDDLKLFHTEVITLEKDFETNVSPKLTSLFMIKTNTAKLGKSVFANLKSLSELHIRNSTIKILKRSMFAKPAAIQSFNFESNQIEFLPDDIFSDMPHLREVVLSNNKISILKEAPFTAVLKIVQILVLE
ncbi:uncharacterized protein TNIN_156151, partial [Trichonephila inaurata madagascariensis]